MNVERPPTEPYRARVPAANERAVLLQHLDFLASAAAANGNPPSGRTELRDVLINPLVHVGNPQSRLLCPVHVVAKTIFAIPDPGRELVGFGREVILLKVLPRHKDFQLYALETLWHLRSCQ